MHWVDLLQQQLLDPFRIGLLVALLATTARTQGVTGTIIPLLAGAIFVAVIIPTTISPPGDEGLVQSVAVGFAANLLILTAIVCLWQAYLRITRRGDRH